MERQKDAKGERTRMSAMIESSIDSRDMHLQILMIWSSKQALYNDSTSQHYSVDGGNSTRPQLLDEELQAANSC